MVFTAKDTRQLSSRLIESLPTMLTKLGVDAQAIESERSAMQDVRLGRTASAKVLESLKELMFQVDTQPH